MDEKTRTEIALKKFSLIAPLVNGLEKNASEYLKKVCAEPIEMPHYGLKRYQPKTLRAWLLDYRRGGLDNLKPDYRSDRGKSRKVSEEVTSKAQKIWAKMPFCTVTNVYEELVKSGVTSPDKISPATFYRFVSVNKQELKTPVSEENNSNPEQKRFAHEYINELWQTDLMFGPFIKDGRSKNQAYLLAFIDDASRLICHAEFFETQNFSALRKVFKDAVLKRGIPKLVYTDNGKIYRSGQMACVCAGLGSHLIHTQPYTPQSKGKIERFFLTVRQRFLTTLDINNVKNVDELNIKFWQWLEEDYQRKLHSALGMSPLDFFMSQASRVKIFSDPLLLDEYFLLRVERKVKHDGTISLNNLLYETNLKHAGQKLEIRYEPDWVNQLSKEILLYHEGKLVGTARQVNYHDNAHAKRVGSKSGSKNATEKVEPANEIKDVSNKPSLPNATISYTAIMQDGEVTE